MAAKNSKGWNLILDAKTWFVKEFSPDTFLENKKPALRTIDIQPDFDTGWRFLLNMWGINYTDQVIGPGGVPFLMDSRILEEIEKDLQQQGWKNLVDFFCRHVMHPYFITEFNLYSAYVLKKYHCYSNAITGNQTFEPVNIAVGQESEFERLFQDMQDFATLTVSIHRNCQLTDEQHQRWSQWLKTKKLNI